MLGYDDMVTHKAALDGKDIHLCVDVYADANGQLVFDKDKLPRGLKKLYFQNTHQDVTSIGYACLLADYELTHVGFSGFTQVTTIEDGFLSYCSSLAHVDLSGFKSVTTIGKWFLDHSDSLTHVNLSGLTNVTTIGYYFLSSCGRLTHVDLSGFKNVITIGNYLLSSCLQLQNIIAPKSLALLIPPELKEKIVEVD